MDALGHTAAVGHAYEPSARGVAASHGECTSGERGAVFGAWFGPPCAAGVPASVRGGT